MLNRIREFIEQGELLVPHERVIVGLSGGADSVALLLALQQLGYQVEAAHCNFHLRGEESNRDEEFVKQLCKEKNIPIHLAHYDTLAYAQLHKVSIEMAARELRYRYFEQLCEDIGCKTVCIAHHRDDNIETMLLNLFRGTGIQGLTGIRPSRPTSNDCRVVRPLLTTSKKDIVNWLDGIHQAYVTDSTNLVDDIARNQLRLKVIPMLQEINPAVQNNLQATIEMLTEAKKIYDSYVSSIITRTINNDTLSIKELKETASPLCILFEWLKDYHFTPATIRQIHHHLDAETGKTWQSCSHVLCKDRDKLILSPHHSPFREIRIPETGTYICKGTGKIHIKTTTDVAISKEAYKVSLDAEKVSFPLKLRSVQEGDKFVPFGMKGSKLVNDFLTDKKIPLIEKRHQLVVCDKNNNIVWLIGHRTAAPYSITNETTRMLLMEFEFEEPHSEHHA